MSNYKLEVENTEKLNNDIVSAFAEINTELEKDDDLIASDLFDVDKKIEELKKSRKKWAIQVFKVTTDSGESTVNIDTKNLSFTPSYAFSTNFLWTFAVNEYTYYYISSRDRAYFSTATTDSIDGTKRVYYAANNSGMYDNISPPSNLELMLFE